MIEKPEWDYYDSDPEAINSLLAKFPNLFDDFVNITDGRYDIIVSNPPYIKTSQICKI